MYNLQANNTEDMIKLLQKAQVTAKEGKYCYIYLKRKLDTEYPSQGGNTYQEGLNYHKLGLAYEKLNDYDTALQVLHSHWWGTTITHCNPFVTVS